VKLSVSLRDEDVTFIDEYASGHGVESRSAVVQRAVALLRAGELAPAYAAAFDEWESSGEAKDWDEAIGDGL